MVVYDASGYRSLSSSDSSSDALTEDCNKGAIKDHCRHNDLVGIKSSRSYKNKIKDMTPSHGRHLEK